MVQVEPDYSPQVLLLGNGLNRAYGADSWNGLLKKIKRRKDLPEKLTCPNPLRAILVTNDQVGEMMEKYKDDLFGVVDDALIRQLHNLLAIEFDDILTTNYSYEIEEAATFNYKISESFLKKTCYNIEDGKRVEPKYLLHTCQKISFNGHENRIWHIHGEARKPNSIILSHYHYARILHELISIVKKRGNAYQHNQEKRSRQIIRSWIDTFLLGDVYILGFELDFSEIDMWWLLDRKKREKAHHGKVFFYSPGGDAFNEKEELLKLLNVEIIHCGIPKPQGSDFENTKQYRKFYQQAIIDIQNKVDEMRDHDEEYSLWEDEICLPL